MDEKWIELAQDRVKLLGVEPSGSATTKHEYELETRAFQFKNSKSLHVHNRVQNTCTMKPRIPRFYSINIAVPCSWTNSNGYNI
jgi:hypothetical protein